MLLELFVPMVAGELARNTRSVPSLGGASKPDWMRDISDDRLISEMSIPGTHQSLSTIGSVLKWAMCQEEIGRGAEDSLVAQLKAGIRMIDVRVRINNNVAFTIFHGDWYLHANFDDVLITIRDFLRSHPSETVLMRLKNEREDTEGQHGLHNIFDKYVTSQPNLFWSPSVCRTERAKMPCLGEVRGKLVLVVMNGAYGETFSGYGLECTHDWSNKTYVQDDFKVTDIREKCRKVQRFLQSTNRSDDRSKLWVNFTSGIGNPPLGYKPVDVAREVNKFLLKYLNEGNDITRTGAIMMDFPTEALINAIIKINF